MVVDVYFPCSIVGKGRLGKRKEERERERGGKTSIGKKLRGKEEKRK